MTTDAHGNRWLCAALAPAAHARLAAAHSTWATASDDEIAAAKAVVAAAAGVSGEGLDSMRGMACADFLYMYNTSAQHFFVHVAGGDERVLIYEGECDMRWSMCAPFDLVQMQIDCAMHEQAQSTGNTLSPRTFC